MSQEQMPVVYPVSNTIPTPNHSSNGSYGTVFIVLAIIIFVSAFACFLGRLFNKRQEVAPKPSKHTLPTKEKHAMHNNGKDGDIEFGYENKRFASAKVAATGKPPMGRTDPFGEAKMERPNSFREPTTGRTDPFPKMERPNSFHEPTMAMGRPSSFQEPNKMESGSSSFGEPAAMGRPADSFQDPYKVYGANLVRDPPMGRPDSFREPTMGRPNSFDHKGELSQGDHEMRFDGNQGTKLNFIPRTRPQRY